MNNEQIYDFGIRLRQLRKARGLSRAIFAKKLGVSKETIYRYESNVQIPSLSRAVQIAIILHTSVDYLVGLEDKYTVRLPSLTQDQHEALNLFLRAFVENPRTGSP